ncbi:MAG TPA: HAD family hydrolase [Solirubrobacterales bacterium]|nr:HAD family hydrolase [Solirubrobacterales bacterium]
MASRLAVAAITLDFGNTLVRVDRPGLQAVVERTGDALAAKGIVDDPTRFRGVWAEERERQFREDIPEFKEPDIARRAIRVLARLRGMASPPAEDRWDDVAAAELVEQAEVDVLAEAYSAEFVSRVHPHADATATLAQLSGRGITLAILSNWPLAATIDRFAATHGWLPYLQAIVVSERVGWIKPHPGIFRATEAALGLGQASGGAILHVGDDWAADVVGASQAGWRTAYLRNRQAGSPLPSSEPGDGLLTGVGVAPDLEIDELAELDALVEPDPGAGVTTGAMELSEAPRT